MLIKCPECNLQVSDQAISCPHCGYVISKSTYKRMRARTTRRKRLPNGFGQISKITNKNLQKPYRAMVTIGKNDNGRPVCKLLKPVAYFSTYNEAYEALLANAKDPYTPDKDITVQEVYERWYEKYEKKVSKGRLTTIRGAWRYAKHLYNVRFADIRVRHIVEILENGQVEEDGVIIKIGENVKVSVLTIFRGMYDYAIEYEIVDRNYAKDVNTSTRIDVSVQKGHKAFTKDELDKLWENINDPYVMLMLINCYTGWRPSEILDLKLSDVNIKEGYLIGGKKTDAGKERIVPLCPKIKEFVLDQYYNAKQEDSEYLFYRIIFTKQVAAKITYTYFVNEFNRVLKELNLDPEHTPHDCRKTFVTIAKERRLDEYAIKYVVGHKIKDLTERVYTERTKEWLQTEMNKIV